MNFIKKIWFFKAESSHAKQPKKIAIKAIAIKALGLFVALIILFTIVSRAADSLSLAVVRTTSVSGSVIVHEIRSDGVVEGGTGVPIVLLANLLITETVVKEGGTVKEGDLIMSYDTSEIEELIEAKQLSLAALNTELSIIQQKESQSKETGEIGLQRKEYDISSVEEDFSLKLKIISEEMRIARLQLNKYNGVRRDDYDDEDYTEEEYNRLRANLNALQLQYEQLEHERDQALLKIERASEDMEITNPDASQELKRLEIQQLNLELSVLYEQIEQDGKVYATADGVLMGFGELVGKRTTNEAIGYIAGEENFQFVSEISEDEKKYIQIGDKVSLEIFGEQKKVENLLVANIEPISDKMGMYNVTIKLSGDRLTVGNSATLVASRSSQKYDMCVELPSLYSEGDKNYVFVVAETQTVLGAENTLGKIQVEVLDKNEKYAAITAVLPPQAKIVNYSDKPINAGDRVRVEL